MHDFTCNFHFKRAANQLRVHLKSALKLSCKSGPLHTALAEQPFDASEFSYAFLEAFGKERQRVHPLTEYCRQRMQATGLAALIGQAL